MATSAAGAATCEELSSVSLPDTRILLAQTQPAGAFTPPPVQTGGPSPLPNSASHGTPAPNPALTTLPSFCRVSASLNPTSDSDIRIEVWMPVAGWNGKLQSVGNGAWAGTIPYTALGNAVAAGYAGAATDTGHVGNTATFAPGHPEKMWTTATEPSTR